MNATVSRAKIRFGAYAAMAAVLILIMGLFSEFRLPLGAVLLGLALWWVRLDPVGPDGEAFDPARWKAAIFARLHRLIG